MTDRPSPSTVTDEGLVEVAANAIRDLTGGENYDYMDFCRDAARAALEASGHTALLRDNAVLRGRLQNAVFALEYWEREQRVHTGLYGPSRWSEGPYERGKEEIAKGNAALSRP